VKEIFAWVAAVRAHGTAEEAYRRWKAEKRRLMGPRQKAAALGITDSAFAYWRRKACTGR
jgi:hypothetical protein